jgi:hypothetical protein
VNERHANVLARELLDLEDAGAGGDQGRAATEKTVLAALKSLLPELGVGDRTAVTRCVDGGEERVFVLLLASSALFRLWLERPPGEPLRVAVDRAGKKSWRVLSVHEGVEPNGEGSEGRRGWALVFNDALMTFTSSARPAPDAAERLGRALAAVEGWEIDWNASDEKGPTA